MGYPMRANRKRAAQADWLMSLTMEEIERRLPKSGGDGFYRCERVFLSEHCVFETIREKLKSEVDEQRRRIQEVASTQRELKAAKAVRLQSRVDEAQEHIDALTRETPGEVRDAAMRAAELYVSGAVPRTLKQCMCIAASEHMVAMWAVQSYLCGIGARTLWADVDA